MKIQVICQHCGKKVCEVSKPEVSDADLDMYQHSASCEDHGPNVYEYDEEGILLSSIIHVVAIRSEN